MKPDLRNTSPAAGGLGLYAESVTPDDNADIVEGPAKLWIGTGGNIQVTLAWMDANQSVLFKNVPDGFAFPNLVRRVWNTNTTAADIVACW